MSAAGFKMVELATGLATARATRDQVANLVNVLGSREAARALPGDVQVRTMMLLSRRALRVNVTVAVGLGKKPRGAWRSDLVSARMGAWPAWKADGRAAEGLVRAAWLLGRRKRHLRKLAGPRRRAAP